LPSHEFGAINAAFDMLTFCVSVHPLLSRYLFVKENIFAFFSHFIKHSSPLVKFCSIKFLKAIVTPRDQFSLRHLVNKNAFKPFFDVLKNNNRRRRLLTSSFLSIIVFAMENNLEILIDHFSEQFFDDISSFQFSGHIVSQLQEHKNLHAQQIVEDEQFEMKIINNDEVVDEILPFEHEPKIINERKELPTTPVRNVALNSLLFNEFLEDTAAGHQQKVTSFHPPTPTTNGSIFSPPLSAINNPPADNDYYKSSMDSFQQQEKIQQQQQQQQQRSYCTQETTTTPPARKREREQFEGSENKQQKQKLKRRFVF
jgi:hypothetical protein